MLQQIRFEAPSFETKKHAVKSGPTKVNGCLCTHPGFALQFTKTFPQITFELGQNQTNK